MGKVLSFPIRHVWQKDVGFRLARIRNLAIQRSKSDYLIFIDGDIILHPNFVGDHIGNVKKNTFLAGSRVLLSNQMSKQFLEKGTYILRTFSNGYKNQLNGIRNSLLSSIFSSSDSNIFNVRGCNMSFWKNDLYAVNGFDERYEGWGREDSDLVQRLLNHNKYKIKLKFKAIQYHLYHGYPKNESLEQNNLLLSNTIDSNKLWAEVGLNNNLNEV